MDVTEAIANRRSIRQYVEESIPDEHMNILLKSLQLAPSANNSQNWEFIFVDDDELKKRLIPACFHQRFLGECAYFIAGVANPGLRWHMVDITIAMTSFTLQAHELGYGTCWIGAFDEAMVKKVLGVPKDKKVVICMTFGRPKTNPLPKGRKPLKTFVYHNGFGKSWKRAQ